jgi:hypothetical protein
MPGLPDTVGNWVFPGVECEVCHGPGNEMQVNQLAEACGTCHKHPDTDGIEAANGFIRSEGQYSERGGPHWSWPALSQPAQGRGVRHQDPIRTATPMSRQAMRRTSGRPASSAKTPHGPATLSGSRWARSR